MKIINIQIGNKNFTAKLFDNAAAQALIKKLPFSLKMSDLNKNEKYFYLSENLPTNSQHIDSIQAGDLMLYNSNCIVIFYKNFQTSYSYTKLGSIENSSELLEILGQGSVEVKFNILN